MSHWSVGSEAQVSLPLEVLENVILDFWNMPLTTAERVAFMTTSLLVNTVWMASFIRASSTHIHIPTESYVRRFFSLLRGESILFTIDNRISDYPHILARSITFHISDDVNSCSMTSLVSHRRSRSRVPDELEGDHPMGVIMQNMLYQLQYSNLPNLNKLHIHYHNLLHYTDNKDRARFFYFPSYITQLDLTYTFHSGSCSGPLASLDKVGRGTIMETTNSDFPKDGIPFIRKLTILGAGTDMVRDVTSKCPNMDGLTTDGHVSLDQLSIDKSIITVV